MVLIIKKYFSLFFTRKCEKFFLLHLLVTLKSYNLGIVEELGHRWRQRLFIMLLYIQAVCTKWGFSRSANLMVSFKLTQTNPCCHGNQPLLNKISYNSACIEDTPRLLHRTGLFRVVEFNCVSEICLRPTAVAVVR